MSEKLTPSGHSVKATDILSRILGGDEHWANTINVGWDNMIGESGYGIDTFKTEADYKKHTQSIFKDLANPDSIKNASPYHLEQTHETLATYLKKSDWMEDRTGLPKSIFDDALSNVESEMKRQGINVPTPLKQPEPVKPTKTVDPTPVKASIPDPIPKPVAKQKKKPDPIKKNIKSESVKVKKASEPKVKSTTTPEQPKPKDVSTPPPPGQPSNPKTATEVVNPGVNKTTVGSITKNSIKKGYSSWSGLGTKGKMTTLGAIGGSIGMLGSDDGIVGSVIDGAVGAGLAIGAGTAAEYIINKHGKTIADESRRIAKDVKENGITVGDVSNEKVRVKAEGSLHKINEMKKMKNNLSKMKVAGAIGLTAFAAASIIDTNKEAKQNIDARRMKQEQEKNLNRNKGREEQVMKQFQYGGPSDMGSIAIDMFNQRIGHHLMGNAKFQ